MPATNSNDPHRTTDREATPAPVGTDNPGNLAQCSPTLDEVTPAHEPGYSTKPGGAELESASATVFVRGYEIEGVLGRGGMGIVYKARHLALKRTVALKMVLAGGHAGPHELARFRIEAEAVARLQHPNIVQIHEVGEADGHPYCALEFVEGGTLADKIRGKPMPARDAARLVEALARAMQLAHSRNVVHRDLKPANVLVAAGQAFQPDSVVRLENLTYVPKISDFGLARQMDSDSGETQAGAVMGTPAYMAPEQASGHAHEAGPAADVYALGAILYECLAGRPPFKEKTAIETLDRVRTQEPVPPSHWQTGVPLDLETVCLKCLRKEPEKRYTSAAELADDLVRYQRGEPILARPVGNLERMWKWVKRNPGRAAAGAAAVLVVVGAVVAGFQFQQALADQRVQAEEKRLSDLAATNAELEQEKDKLEAALARSCLSPLTEASGPLNDAEIGALAEVAAGRGKPLARRFVTLTLLDSQGMRKLGARFQYALHAVVGLDDRERKTFERLLEDKLQKLDPLDPSGTNLALAASQLGALSPNAAGGVAQALLPALNKTNDPAALVPLAQGLSSVAGRLEPREAATAAAMLTQAITRTGDPNVLQPLVRSLSLMTDRLEPRDAAEIAAKIAQALTKPNNTLSGGALAQSLSSVAARLEPAAAAATLMDAMNRPNLQPYVLKFLVQGLSLVAPRLGPKDATAVVAAVTGDMIRTVDVGATQSLEQCLAAAAARLAPADAARAAATLMQGMNRPFGFVDPESLVRGLSSLAGRLDPREVAKIAAAATQALIKTTNPAIRPALGRVLEAMAPRLEPGDAAEAAAALTEAMTKTNDDRMLISLVQGLPPLAGRLKPKEAGESAARLTRIMAGSDDFAVLNNLTQGLTKLATRLQADRAAEAAAVLTEAMTKANEPALLGPLAEALSLLAARLEPTQAARVSAEAAGTLMQALEKSNNPHVLWSLARGLSAVSPFQDSREAARVSAQAAAKLIQGLGKTANPFAILGLAAGLSGMAARLQSAQAGEAVATVTQVMTTARNTEALKALMQALSALAARLEPREAANAVALLRQSAARTTHPTAVRYLTEGLSVVAARLEPKEAAAALTAAMSGTANHVDLKTLAEGLAGVAARLGRMEAARTCAKAAVILTQAMAATNDPYALGSLGQGLSAVADRLDPREAAETAGTITRAMSLTNDPYAIRSLAEGLSAVAARLESRDVVTAAAALISTLARTNSSDPLQQYLTQGLAAVLGDGQRLKQTVATAAAAGSLNGHGLFGALTLLLPALEPLPRRLSDQELVDLLKQPLCVGPARQAILNHLIYHHRRPFSDHWDFIRYAEESKLALDFTSPPRR